MLNPKAMRPAQSYESVYEVTVRAARERVWTALTTEIGDWWPADFYTTDNPVGFVVEPDLGGRVYERWAGGGGVLWGTVVVWLPGYRMTWALELYPETTGPGRGYVTFELEERGADTLVRVSDAGVCIAAKDAATGQAAGWQRLIGGHLKPHAEAGGWSGMGAIDSGRFVG